MNEFSAADLDFLRNCVLLSHLSEENFNTFLSISQKMSYEPDKVLLQEGEESDNLFIIISGEAGLFKNDDNGENKYLIGTLSAGNSIGELRIIKNRPCSLTVKASKPMEVLCTKISQLRTTGSDSFYESVLDSLTLILSDRLISTNRVFVNKIIEKRKQFFLTASIALVLFLLLAELGLAYYYMKDQSHFCNQALTNPAEYPPN